MSLYIMGDIHLSLNDESKSMNIFNGWNNYVQKIYTNWISSISKEDTVILAGDISWSKNLQDAYKDFEFLNSLPGTKIILRGNHDYWFTSKTKVENFLQKNGFSTIKILYNNHYEIENINIVGTRGWMFLDKNENDFDYKKMINRECIRLNLSISNVDKNKETIAIFHYPPIYNRIIINEFIDILKYHNIKKCFYGHIHDKYCKFSFNGEHEGIFFNLISCDFLNFIPFLIKN